MVKQSLMESSGKKVASFIHLIKMAANLNRVTRNSATLVRTEPNLAALSQEQRTPKLAQRVTAEKATVVHNLLSIKRRKIAKKLIRKINMKMT